MGFIIGAINWSIHWLRCINIVISLIVSALIIANASVICQFIGYAGTNASVLTRCSSQNRCIWYRWDESIEESVHASESTNESQSCIVLSRPRCLEPRIKVMRKRPKMSANDISGLLAYTMELFLLFKIGVVAAPMVRSELIYRAFSDGLLDLDFRLVGHQVWREIQIMDM